jgi:hypothetical protein
VKSRTDAGQEPVPIHFTTVLVGSEVELNGDFVYVLNADYACKAFTYSYGFDGIAFEEIGKDWRHEGAISVPSTIALALDWANHREDCVSGVLALDAERAEAARIRNEENIALYGDYSKALLITPNGVLHNEDWLSLPEREEDAAE